MTEDLTQRRARPRAFRLDATGQAPSTQTGTPESNRVEFEVARQPDAYLREAESLVLPADEEAIEIAQRKGMWRRLTFGWGSLFWTALGGLVSFGVGLWVDRLIEDLFARSMALGWVGLGLACLVILSLCALAVREFVGIFRQTQVAKLHASLAAARIEDNREAARTHLQALCALLATRPATASARAEILRTSSEIIDGRDLIDIGERLLLHPLDEKVSREIADAAKKVSLVTAISPRAMLDLVFVVAQLIRLVRRIAEIYSGRPGFFGFLKLAKSVGAHLAVTGGMAVGDSLLQQVVGHGIAAKLSARLGEGVLNGLLTTRVGLSAMAVCRPMPFGVARQPGVKDVAPFLFGASQGADADRPRRSP